MKLAQCKVHDRVYVYVDASFHISSIKQSTKLSATVIDQQNGQVCLGWGAQDGFRPSGSMPLTTGWPNITYYQWVYDHCECEPMTDSGIQIESVSKQGTQEAPCRVCQRMNDIGIRSCYWCGQVPH